MVKCSYNVNKGGACQALLSPALVHCLHQIGYCVNGTTAASGAHLAWVQDALGLTPVRYKPCSKLFDYLTQAA